MQIMTASSVCMVSEWAVRGSCNVRFHCRGGCGTCNYMHLGSQARELLKASWSGSDQANQDARRSSVLWRTNEDHAFLKRPCRQDIRQNTTRLLFVAQPDQVHTVECDAHDKLSECIKLERRAVRAHGCFNDAPAIASTSSIHQVNSASACS